MKPIVFALSMSISAVAADLCVLPSATGSADGSDWSNSLGSSFTPSRGNVYYIGSGEYGSKTWSTANSGTDTITIRKATESAHGPTTGWSSAYDTGSANWTGGWQVSTDYWLFDGVRRPSYWRLGGTNGYGFYISSGQTNGKSIRVDNTSSAWCNNSTFQYLDVKAGGQGTGFGDDVIYGIFGNSNLVFRYCALRDSDRTIFLQRGEWQNLTVEECYIARNNSTPDIHGEMLSDVGSDYQTFKNNVIEDIEGTGVWAVLNGTGSKSSTNTANGWKIYGNVITRTKTNESHSATFYAANDGANSNWVDNLSFFNNTLVNSGSQYYGIYIQAAGTSNQVVNCLWSDTEDAQHVNATTRYNYYNNTSNNDAGTGSTSVTNQQVVASNYHPTARLSGEALDSEFSPDPDGVVRGYSGAWSIGAYEYVGRRATANAVTVGTLISP